MLTENNCTHHYNIKADLKTRLLGQIVIAIEFSDGGANANCKPLKLLTIVTATYN